MNIAQLNKIEELREQQDQLKQYVKQYNDIEREINSTYRQCKHPLKFIHSTDSDDFEGRSYTKTMCIDCGMDWETRSKYINKEDYFDSYEIENTSKNISRLLRLAEEFKGADDEVTKRLNNMAVGFLSKS